MLARRRAVRQKPREERDGFETLALRAAAGDSAALARLPAKVAEARQLFPEGAFDQTRLEVLKSAVRAAIQDDRLTVAEESHLNALMDALGVDLSSLLRSDFALWEALLIARVNAGRPPVVTNPGIMMKRDEIGHGTFDATLIKDVSVREHRSGSSEVSVPVGLGMQYRVGSTRGRSVVVGTQQVVADSGMFVVTSTRSVFVGGKNTLEFRHDCLVGLEEFEDGLRLNVSNRQAASLLKLAKGSALAAALISWCASRV